MSVTQTVEISCTYMGNTEHPYAAGHTTAAVTYEDPDQYYKEDGGFIRFDLGHNEYIRFKIKDLREAIALVEK